MTDPESTRQLARDVLRDEAMDQALTWLIELDTADAAQQARFHAWLAESPAHREAFERAHAVWHSPEVTQVARSVDRPARRLRRSRWLSMASAALLVLGVVGLSDAPMRLRADHMTQVGERQRLELADGAKVLLGTHSALANEDDPQRRITRLLQGEAFFEVPPGKGLPLQVEAGPLRMNGSSTAFAVRYLDGVAQVQVQRGAVDVQAISSATRVSLNAGESLRIGPDGETHSGRMDADKDLAWVSGRLVFENCPLSEVLAELRRYYPGWIVNTNTRLDQVAVTGNYRLDDPLGIVRSLAQITSARLHELPALVILN